MYLKDAQARLQPQIPGFELDIGGLYSMQMLCAYEASQNIISSTRIVVTFLLDFDRLSALDTQNSASCSRRRSGKGLITRKHTV